MQIIVNQTERRSSPTVLARIKHPLIAEGNIDTPEKVKRVLELGAYSVVVGSAITRPQLITKKFVDAIQQVEKH